MYTVRERIYPAREHRHVPTCPEEVIEDELRSSGSGEAFRDNILYGLGSIYGASPLGRSILEHANVLGLARQYIAEIHGNTLTAPDTDRAQAFYSGALLALHAKLSIEESDQRRRILQRGIGHAPIEDNESADQIQRRLITEVLVASDQQIEWFNGQTDTHQCVVVTAAEQAYGAGQLLNACESEMIFGYAYISAEIESVHGMAMDE